MTAERRKEKLSEIADDKSTPPAVVIKAIDTLNKMTGEYTVKVEAEVQTSEKFADILSQVGGEGLAE